MAYDPGNTDAMLLLIQAAHAADMTETVMWIGPILHRANTDTPKPDLAKFMKLKDIYKAMGQWELAVSACQSAVALRPDDMDLNTELKHLGAQSTMSRGNYEKKGGSFVDSVKDMDSQKKLMDSDKDVRDVDVLSRQLIDAEAEFKAQPEEAGKLMKYVDALIKTEKMENENTAIDVLTAAYERTKQFRFRQAVGKIKMGQMNRMERGLREKVARNPGDQATREEYASFRKDKVEEELKEYTLWAENYPSDMTFKFQVGQRMFELGQHGEAIPVFQSARQDPKLRMDAALYLGRAFLEAEFVDEAVDTMRELVESYQVKGDDRSKLIYYWYARALEAHNDVQVALKAYSQLAQWDFNYRDVQARIKKLRSSAAGPAAPK
jgi:tetratricopeptide (TPR) repeat protein